MPDNPVRSVSRARSCQRWLAALLAALVLPGCAIHYYDPNSGTEHLWGFGHLKMRAGTAGAESPVPTNSVVAFVTGQQTLGLSLAAGRERGGLVAGWDSNSRVMITAEDAQFHLMWPSNSIRLPWDLQS